MTIELLMFATIGIFFLILNAHIGAVRQANKERFDEIGWGHTELRELLYRHHGELVRLMTKEPTDDN